MRDPKWWEGDLGCAAIIIAGGVAVSLVLLAEAVFNWLLR